MKHDLPVVARLYTRHFTSKSVRRASVLPGDGEPLVKEADALRIIRELEARIAVLTERKD